MADLDRELQLAKLRIEELRSEITFHDYRYHVLDQPQRGDDHLRVQNDRQEIAEIGSRDV